MSRVFASLPVNPFEADVIREPREVTYSVQGLNDNPLNHLIAEFGRLTIGELQRSPIPSPKAQLLVSPEAGYGKSKAFSSRRTAGNPDLSSSVPVP